MAKKKPFSLKYLSQLEAQIIGVIGLAGVSLTTQEIYEGVLISEASRYFKIINKPDLYLKFIFDLECNKEKTARALVKDFPLSNYNTINRHLDFLKSQGWVEVRTIKHKKAKRLWRLPRSIYDDVEKNRDGIYKDLAKRMELFFKTG